MIITFVRSSSYGTHSICPHKYYLEYVLGIRPPSGKAADKGTIVHKALEVLAQVSLCRASGATSYVDEAFGLVDINQVTPDWATQAAWDFYTPDSPHIEWEKKDLDDCLKWTNKAITFNDGRYDPRNLDIIAQEQRFNFEIDEPWAHYDYTLDDGTRLVGQLGIKGTIDLITRNKYGQGIVEIIDWKTGQRKDWSKEGWEKKTYEDICHDPQLCLYHYAACRLYPDAEEIWITIYYINDGGPYSVCFCKEDLAYTEKMLSKKFNEIRDTTVPFLNVGRKCTGFCHFGKTMSTQDPSKTVCQFFADQVRTKGIEATTHEFGRTGAYNEYGDGGGRKAPKEL
jgi:ATP-dependent helicase/DNAse subunit B